MDTSSARAPGTLTFVVCLGLLGASWTHAAVAEHCVVAWFESPQDNVVWHVGEEQLIVWTFAGPDQGCLIPAQVELPLTRNGGQREVIAILPGDARSYVWNVSGPVTADVILEFTRTYEDFVDDRTTYAVPIEIEAQVPASTSSWGTIKARFRD